MDKRSLLSVPFCSRTTRSYGLAVYALDTKKWLLVQRKHTVAFLTIVRGRYRVSNLKLLIPKLTEEECQKLYDYINYGYNIFEDIEMSIHSITYAKKRLDKDKHVIIKILNNNFCYGKLLWTFPKGKREYKIFEVGSFETSFDCALREFLEEVEIELPEPNKVSINNLYEKIKIDNGYTIEGYYWIYVIDNEISITKPSHHEEVADRKWFNLDEFDKIYHHYDQKLISTMKNIEKIL